MLTISPRDVELILNEVIAIEADSNLGFFSKPVRIIYNEKELMIKKYLPVSDHKFICSIIENHEKYISELKKPGIKIPDTFITTLKTKSKFQIIIIQEAYQKKELLRNLVENSPTTELWGLFKLIFDDVMRFWVNRNNSSDIGFHPTLRNYALHEGNLYYFDTFPPMLMKQRELNKIILKMSPFGGFFKVFIPLSLINKVSDEYYNIEKMLTGIVGSFCRLRPENTGSILTFSKEFIKDSSCADIEKKNILRILNSPPRLSVTWTFFRSLSGNAGKPNVKS